MNNPNNPKNPSEIEPATNPAPDAVPKPEAAAPESDPKPNVTIAPESTDVREAPAVDDSHEARVDSVDTTAP